MAERYAAAQNAVNAKRQHNDETRLQKIFGKAATPRVAGHFRSFPAAKIELHAAEQYPNL
jgi:hypothetical protein